MAKIYVLHENAAWLPPLRQAFAALGLPYEEWFLNQGSVDLGAPPPDGVFYNRMSASSFTRDHVHAPELTAGMLAWLQAHGRRVVNDGRALDLEVSKVKQYAALSAHGIRTPRTVAAVGRDAVVAAASDFGPGPMILKPNRGGKGHDVRLFDDAEALIGHVGSDAYEAPVDGVALVQQYIAAPGALSSPVRNSSAAASCTPSASIRRWGSSCARPTPAPWMAARRCRNSPSSTPSIRELQAGYERFLAANGIEVAGIEFIVDRDGANCHIRHQHQYQLQSRCRVAGRPLWHGRAGAFPRRRVGAVAGSPRRRLIAAIKRHRSRGCAWRHHRKRPTRRRRGGRSWRIGAGASRNSTPRCGRPATTRPHGSIGGPSATGCSSITRNRRCRWSDAPRSRASRISTTTRGSAFTWR